MGGKNKDSSAQQLSRELRRESGSYLKQRRAIAGLSISAISCMAIVSLYQMGIIKHLPEPKLPGLDADKVDASDEAYTLLDTPDAVIGLASYAATLGLAAMGGKERNRDKPWISLLLAAKTAVDASQSARLTYGRHLRQRRPGNSGITRGVERDQEEERTSRGCPSQKSHRRFRRPLTLDRE